MNKALTMPRATAGNMGAMATMAGTVVVTGTVVVVVTPPVATPVLPPPPATTVCRSCGRKGSGGRAGRLRGLEETRLRERKSRTEIVEVETMMVLCPPVLLAGLSWSPGRTRYFI